MGWKVVFDVGDSFECEVSECFDFFVIFLCVFENGW